MSKTKQITGLVVSLGLVFLVGWLGAFVTQMSLGVWLHFPDQTILDSFRGHHRVDMDNPLRLDGNCRLVCLVMWRSD